MSRCKQPIKQNLSEKETPFPFSLYCILIVPNVNRLYCGLPTRSFIALAAQYVTKTGTTFHQMERYCQGKSSVQEKKA
jgi:hypothetical protein